MQTLNVKTLERQRWVISTHSGLVTTWFLRMQAQRRSALPPSV